MGQDEWSLTRYWTMLAVRHTSTVELGLQVENLRVTVNFLNGRTDSFETKIFQLNLKSLDGTIDVKIAAFTTERVSGNIEAINFAKYAKKLEHLKGITLPWTTPNHRHFCRYQSKRGVIRKPVKTVARLTAFGWTRSAIQTVLMRDAIEQVSLTLILYVPTIRAATKLQTPKGLGDRIAKSQL